MLIWYSSTRVLSTTRSLNKRSFLPVGALVTHIYFIQAVGVQPAEKGGVTLLTKKGKHLNRPASNQHQVAWGGNTSGPKSVFQACFPLLLMKLTPYARIYKGIVNHTAKQGYRADLRQEAVARASAIKHSQKQKNPVPEPKLRGSKAKKAEEKAS